MKLRKFSPNEILFSPTMQCNLNCAHCNSEKTKITLNKAAAMRFLEACCHAGIDRISFTGGEPFYAFDFMSKIISYAIKHKISFGRIMSNGAWFKTKDELTKVLTRLFHDGYDGGFCLSVDAFHQQDLQKVASFIGTAIAIWKRPDIVSIAAVKGAKENETHKQLSKLAGILKARFSRSTSGHSSIKNKDFFIKILPIDLSPVGKAARLKNPWDGIWFKDDFCKGPGNVFFVLPDGTVKPCCGYATDTDNLTIGSIKHDNPQKLLKNAENNRFVNAVFRLGLHSIRKMLEKSGVKFPGKTTNHCFFCHYITHCLPRATLDRCLEELNSK